MAQTIKTRILARRDTTANWDAAIGFIPMQGEIIIYTDHDTMLVDGVAVNVPGIKIGSGNAYVQDLAFVGELERDVILDHIENTDIHVSSADKLRWDGKLNVDDENEVVNEALVFNRN